MHAGWNAVGKHRVPTTSFFLLASFGGLLVLVFAPVTWTAVWQEYGRAELLLICGAGFFEAIYFTGLGGGYRAGDLSLVYPLARSVPAVTVAIGSVLLGREDEITTPVWIGSFLIVLGCVFLPQTRFRDLRLHNYTNRTFLFAMLAAAGTTGYSLVDDTALGLLRPANPDLHPAFVTLTYSFCQVLATSLWLGVFVLPFRVSRQELRASSLRWKHAVATGAFIAVTYSIVLVALAFARDVSYVVAFRQTSIPIGVGIGVLFFKESMPPPKLLGTVVLVVGLILVALA